ncbi:MAG TPA: hypothetical protein VFI37_07475 [Gaiellaceae bacterium]|nr:hypothetical protein [Gaiellaceae bacterium]
MRFTRRQAIAGAAGVAALGSAGIYELVDQLTASPPRAAAVPPPPEQHLLQGVRAVHDNGVEVLVPPLHDQVVTAKVAVDGARHELRAAQAELEYALTQLERRFEPSPAGLGITLAWGLPYFHRFVPGEAESHLPLDRRAGTGALLDAVRFPSDPPDAILEANDVAVLLRSDSLEHIAEAAKALFDDMDVLEPTSIRRGFAGGGFEGGRSLPKRMATAAGIPGADLIPETAELFLGFTSTQRANMGPDRIANLETLGYADLRDSGYFRRGTHMHLSHIDEDVEAWFLNFDFRERVDTMFQPNLKVDPGTQTVPQDAEDTVSQAQVRRDFRLTGRIGHSGAIQSASRLPRDVVGDDGTVYPKGTAVPQRADFNTLDNPFAWSAHPQRDGMGAGPSAGVHFVIFNPTSDDFARNRLAMDGVLPGGKRLPFRPRARGQGFNAVLRTTHRQNFLVPPRAHRSFPLVELPA